MKTNHIRRNDNPEHKKIVVTKEDRTNLRKRSERMSEVERKTEKQREKTKREKKGTA